MLIASNEELEFVYDSCMDGILVINATIKTKRCSTTQQEENTETNAAESSKKEINLNSGRWTAEEKLLYQKGCKIFGPSNPKLISQYIGTRTSKQVQDFSATPSAKRFKFDPLFHQNMYYDAVSGMKAAVELAQREQEKNIEKAEQEHSSNNNDDDDFFGDNTE